MQPPTMLQILKQSSYFMQLSISPCLKSDYFQIIFIPERIQLSNLCVSLCSVFFMDYIFCAGFVSCDETNMSVNIFHLCFQLRVTGCITSCSVMTEQFIAGEKDMQTRQQSRWMKITLNKVLLIQINHKKIHFTALNTVLVLTFTVKEHVDNDWSEYLDPMFLNSEHVYAILVL